MTDSKRDALLVRPAGVALCFVFVLGCSSIYQSGHPTPRARLGSPGGELFVSSIREVIVVPLQFEDSYPPEPSVSLLNLGYSMALERALMKVIGNEDTTGATLLVRTLFEREDADLGSSQNGTERGAIVRSEIVDQETGVILATVTRREDAIFRGIERSRELTLPLARQAFEPLAVAVAQTLQR